MEKSALWRGIAAAAAIAAASIAFEGCASHPDDMVAVNDLLAKNKLLSVTPQQNRRTGVLTLTGIVDTAEQKAKAEALARQAAPEYTIDDKIRLESSGLENASR
jgi:hypothetical protein